MEISSLLLLFFGDEEKVIRMAAKRLLAANSTLIKMTLNGKKSLLVGGGGGGGSVEYYLVKFGLAWFGCGKASIRFKDNLQQSSQVFFTAFCGCMPANHCLCVWVQSGVR